MKMPCRMGDGVHHDTDGFVLERDYETRHKEKRAGYRTPLYDIPKCQLDGPVDDPLDEPDAPEDAPEDDGPSM